MCKCNPNDPRPFCGEPDDMWPDRPAPSDLKQNTIHLFNTTDAITTLCQHVANGGNVLDLCAMWHCDNFTIMRLIKTSPEWDQLYKAAREAHSDWLEDRIMGELKLIAFCDIREAYDEDGDLRAVKDMPESVARAAASLDVDEIHERDAAEDEHVLVGYTKKLKLHSKLDAIKMLGDFRGMWKRQNIETFSKTLEDLICGSKKNETP